MPSIIPPEKKTIAYNRTLELDQNSYALDVDSLETWAQAEPTNQQRRDFARQVIAVRVRALTTADIEPLTTLLKLDRSLR